MSDRVQELTVFIRAADSGSFTRTARELGLSQPSVSRIVGELEARLGVKLLLRTTRKITLTDAGALFLEHARQVLQGLEDADDAARGADSLRGMIRLALPVQLATRAVIPHLPAFLAEHPLLRLDLTVSDERQDLVAEGVDVAIRMGNLEDSSFGARKLASLKRLLVATPGYLAAHGTPAKPADLPLHECIFGPRSLGRETWTFTRAGKTVSVDVQGRIRTNSGPGLFACVMAGLGIANASSAMSRVEIDVGTVIPVLPDYVLEPIEVHAVFPGGPRPSARVRALVDYIAAHIDEGGPPLAKSRGR